MVGSVVFFVLGAYCLCQVYSWFCLFGCFGDCGLARLRSDYVALV